MSDPLLTDAEPAIEDDYNESGQCAECGDAITNPDDLGNWYCRRCLEALADEVRDSEYWP